MGHFDNFIFVDSGFGLLRFEERRLDAISDDDYRSDSSRCRTCAVNYENFQADLILTEKSIQKFNWRESIIAYAPLFLWLGVIFFLSSSNGSMSRTSLFVRPLLEWLFPAATEETLQIYHGYVRKFAHFFEYAMLGFFASRAFWSSSINLFKKYWYVFALLLVCLTASIDEYNQSFNVLRTGSIYDVLIDSAGGLMMIIFLSICQNSLCKRAV